MTSDPEKNDDGWGCAFILVAAIEILAALIESCVS